MTISDAWLIPVFPATAFVILLLFGAYLPRKGDFIAIAGIGAAFIAFFPIAYDFTHKLATVPEFHGAANSRLWSQVPGAIEMRLGVYVDGISIVMLAVVTFVALMVQVYSLGYMKGDRRYGWYYAVMSLFAASMLTLVLADNFLLLYFTWELVGICSFLLIGHYSDRRSAAEAAKKAFITTRIGDVGFLIGVIILWRFLGTFDIQQTFARIHEVPDAWRTAAVVLLFSGAVGKSAQFPLHVWLPDAMEGPSPVSALIHAATMVVAGVYMVARTLPLFQAIQGGPELIASIGMITVLLSALMGLVMRDLKKVVAYSTINSLGLMFVALGAGAVNAAMLYLFAHAFFKSMLFLSAGSVLHSTEELDPWKMGGLAKKMPITALTFGIGAIAMAGMFPVAGYWAKDEILVAAWHWNWIIFAATMVSVPISALYMGRVFILTFTGDRVRDHHVEEHAHESPPVMTVPLLLLAALAIFSGFVVFDQVGRAMGFPGGIAEVVFAHEPEAFAFNWAIGISSLVLVVASLIGAWYIWSGEAKPAFAFGAAMPWAYRILINKFYFDDAYQWLINHVVLVFAGLIAWFDRNMVNDTGVNGAADTTGLFGFILKYQQTGRLPNYALAMTLGIVVFAVVAFAVRA